MTLTAIDCQSFAGGFSLGVNQAGFKVIAKREHAGGFGSPLAFGNRHLLGTEWELEAGDADTWTSMAADLVFGNPPCAGFSTRSSRIYSGTGHENIVDYRGVNSPANSCMWDFVRYAAKCNPQVAIFESVQQAYTGGLSLMRELRDEFEKLTGRQVYLTHVLHSNGSLGGYAQRNRYFWVVSDQPFSVNVPALERRLTVRDAIGDLEDLEPGAVEGHVGRDTPRTRRLSELAAKVEWLPGEKSGTAYKRAQDLGVALDWEHTSTVEIGTSQFAPARMHYDRPAPVLTGKALTEFVHPTLPRFITHREVARIMGYPDEWNCAPAVEAGERGMFWWGKGIPVGSGRWIAEQAANYMHGNFGRLTGTELGEREYVINVEKWLKDNQPPADLPEPLFTLEQCC
jgi:DNA (cytosine-5)-methyltransferase 1